MDWTSLTFIAGNVFAMIIKAVWFKEDTVKRDKWIPVIALVGNFFTRVAIELGGGENESFGIGDMGAAEHGMVYASVLAVAWWRELIALGMMAVVDTVGSVGLHRLKKWAVVVARDEDVKAAPKKRR